jgi:IS4 transposase
MKALKRLSATDLRMGEPTGTKLIHVYDRAGVSYEQWRKWRAKGIYIISREKSNSKAIVIGINQWDKDDDRNTGIISDEIIGVFCGVTMRRVRYLDPISKKIYSYVTSEMNLPPGLIAFLYKMRWDVEKLFDEKKNKLNEVKDWAVSDTAKSIQMNLTFIAHNLLLLFERLLEDKEKLRDEKVHAKRKKRVAEQIAAACRNGLKPNPMVVNCTRITQRSLQFIRWLRSVLWSRTLWRDAISSLRPLMLNYLS